MSTIIIMNFNNFFTKWNLISILTHKNCNQWFTLMQKWLTKENLWFVCEIISVNTLTNEFSFFFSNLDFKSQKINTKILYWLIIYISVDDQEYLINKISTKNVWNVLKFKYKKKLQMMRKQYLMKFVEYKMSENMFINEIWIYLSKLNKKIAATQFNMIDLFKLKWRFQTLLQALLNKYIVICNIIDT